MFTRTRSDDKLNVVDILLKQNLYERLGLKNNLGSIGRIHQAYNARLNLLYDSRARLSDEEMAQAESILDDAYAVLSDRAQRNQYDASLAGKTPVQAEVVKEAVAEVVDDASSALLLDRYQIESLITEGQRCRIFSAVDTRLGRQVIVKRVRPELAYDANHQRLFQKEAELFARFNASNLVKILDYDVASCAVVSEKMAHDLAASIKAGPVNAIRLRDILRDALAGLAALHREGIAHGRVELQHLFADDDGHIKLAVTPGMTGASTALRPSRQTRHLAPELLNEKSFGRPNLAIDVYSLGFVALELLCGNKLATRVSATLNDPEQESENWLVWHASATERLPPIAELFPDLPADLCTLLERMTCKQQHERFADARVCLESLSVEPVMERISISAIPVPNANEGGVEIYGAPPHLHAAYNAPTGISWADVVRKPALLLTPEGRGHLTKLGLAALMLLASMFLLFQPEQASSQIATVDEATNSTMSLDDYEPSQSSLADDNASNSGEAVAEEQPATEVVPLPKQNATPKVTFEVIPQGKVLQVDGEPAMSASGSEWLLSPGAYTARCWNPATEQEFEHSFVVPEGVDYAHFAIPAPANSIEQDRPITDIDPYADVRDQRFYPATIPFEIQGENDSERALQQRQCLDSALRDVIQRPYDRRKVPPFSLAEEPVDPRAAVTLALWAFRAGDLDRSAAMCRASLKAAEHYHVPFVIPLRMLNHLQIDYGQGGLQAAMGECRLMLSWLNQLDSVRPSPAVTDAKDELAWWTGLLIGYATEVPQGLTRQVLDTEALEEHVRRTCSAEQWKLHQIGRLSIVRRFESLKQQRAELPYETGRASERSNSSLPLTSHIYESEVALDDEFTVETRREPRGLPPASSVAPQQFVSYRPLDIPSIAGEVMSTLTKASRSGLVLR